MELGCLAPLRVVGVAAAPTTPMHHRVHASSEPWLEKRVFWPLPQKVELKRTTLHGESKCKCKLTVELESLLSKFRLRCRHVEQPQLACHTRPLAPSQKGVAMAPRTEPPKRGATPTAWHKCIGQHFSTICLRCPMAFPNLANQAWGQI